MVDLRTLTASRYGGKWISCRIVGDSSLRDSRIIKCQILAFVRGRKL